jgi:TPR repeat protein
LERNLAEATMWMEKAAAQGDEDAVKWLAAQVERGNDALHLIDDGAGDDAQQMEELVND